MIFPRTFERSSPRVLCALCVSALSFLFALYAESAFPIHGKQDVSSVRGQSPEEADRKSTGCITCHTSTDEPTMHPTKTVHLACTDCHGGKSSVSIQAGTAPNSSEYSAAKEKAHVQPRNPIFKNRSALPERVFTKCLEESPEYIKFVNSGDLRVAPETCGAAGCHAIEVRAASTSMMTHTGFLWGAALYNNGAFPYKNTRFGESYGREACRNPSRLLRLPRRKKPARKAFSPSSILSIAGKSPSPATSSAFSSAAAARNPNSAIPTARKIPASPTTSSATVVLAPSSARIPFSSACKKLVLSIRSCRSPAPTIIPATIAPAAARRATSSTPTIATPRIPALTQSSAIPALALPLIPRFPKTSRAIPSSTRSPAPSLRASAWSTTFIPARTWSPPTSASYGGTTKSTATKCIRQSSATLRKNSAINPFWAIRKRPQLVASGAMKNFSKTSAALNSIHN